MAEHEQAQGHLDASGPRDVVFCHQCDNEWYQDNGDLICPRCSSEITEIVTPESDPRPLQNSPTVSSPADFQSLRDHNPWPDSDPEEADLEEHITRGPGGSMFISQTIRSRPRTYPDRRPREPRPQGDPNEIMRDFQDIFAGLAGPSMQRGQPGRSGPDDLFPPPAFGRAFRVDAGGPGGPRPSVVGGRFTFTTGPNFQSRNAAGHPDGSAPGEDIATILGALFGQLRPPGEDRRDAPGGMPPGLQTLFASLLNPANARHGDAVYTQEALDQIISTLMEQHPTSNAPGPASPDAIAALPKKTLNEKLLGPEGKGECSVCMDDVFIGTEVVFLPCSHWFHEQCASAWLSEHNTCPICRKGIDGEAAPAENSGTTQPEPASPNTNPRMSERYRRQGPSQFLSRNDSTSARNEARLNSIRNTAANVASEELEGRRRYPSGGEQPRNDSDDSPRRMPGSFRRRSSGLSVENQRDSRRGNTSGSDRSRESQRSSHSSNGNGYGDGNASGSGSGSSGAMGWIRDRLSRRE